MTSGVKTRKKGAIANGKGDRLVTTATSDAEEDMAQVGLNAIRARLGMVLRNPSGYYESRVTTDVTTDGLVISDGGVVYGPWLEGSSSRNSRSRFKGYWTFRTVTQDIGQKLTDTAESSIVKKLRQG